MAAATQSNVPKCLAGARNFAGAASLVLVPLMLFVFVVIRQVEIQSMDSDLLYTIGIILTQCHAVGEHSSVGKELENYAHPASAAVKPKAGSDDDDNDGDGPESPVSYVNTMGFDPEDNEVPPDNTLYSRLTNADGTTAALSPTLRSSPAMTAVLVSLHPERLPEGWAGFASGSGSPTLRVMSVSLHQYHLQCARQWVEPAAFLLLVAKILAAIFAAAIASAAALGYHVTEQAQQPIGETIDVEATRREVLAAKQANVESAQVTKRTLVERPLTEQQPIPQRAPEPAHRVLIDQPEEEPQQQVIGRTPPDI